MSILYGTNVSESIIGSAAADIIYGYIGNDTISGGDGNDTIYGGSGVNSLSGGSGDDVFMIQSLDDYVFGDSGNDKLYVTIDNYFARGQLGSDINRSIESVEYASGVKVLPYFIDNVLRNEGWTNWGNFGSSKTFTYSFEASNASDSNFSKFTEIQKQSARNALKIYSDIAGLTFVEKADGDMTAQVTFSMSQLTSDANWTTLGVTHMAGSYTVYGGSPSQAKIVIDKDFDSSFTNLSTGEGYTTLIHEIGHVLGLADTSANGLLPSSEENNTNTIMSYNREITDLNHLQMFDLASIHYMHGVNHSQRTGNDTYTFSDRYVWDGAGSDTFSAIGQTQAVSIDLRPGSWNFVGARASSILAPGQSYLGFDSFLETAIGGSGNDTLIGNELNNFLNGTTGADSMIGGLGDDNYYVDNTSDIVVESVNQGSDRINTTVSYTLSANIENARALGTSNINLTGNALDNIIYAGEGNNVLNGADGIDAVSYFYATAAVSANLNTNQSIGFGTDLLQNFEQLYGSLFNDTLIGSIGNDSLYGLDGNDQLNGYAGADYMNGGLGDDNYQVDNTSDVVVESVNQGSDRINTTVSYTLSANIENARALGTSNINLTGNALSNIIYAGEGSNVLNGADGTDAVSYFYATNAVNANLNTGQSTGFGTDTLQNIEQLYGSLFNDTLTGSIGNDSLYGLDGNDLLSGSKGVDYMSGALGDDTYLFSSGDSSDVLAESGGSDLLLFNFNINSDQLWFQQLTNNLVISVIGTADKITIVNWYSNATNQVESIKASDGKTLLNTEVQALVSAMSAFSAPTSGQTTLPTSYQTALAPTLAANWS